jgi:putative transcriptional regulator
MNKENFESLQRGLAEAQAYMRGEAAGCVVHQAVDIKAIRKALGHSQSKFAAIYHIPTGTLQDWEQGRRVPDAPARALLAIIAADPIGAAKALEAA